MNKLFPTMAAVVAFSATAVAAEITAIPDGAISDVTVEKSTNSLMIKMLVHPDVFPKKANREVWLRPAIEAGGYTLKLDSVLVAGRTRYYQHLRGNEDKGSSALLRSGSKEAYEYSVQVPYEPWMEYSDLNVTGRVVGCAGCTKADNITTLYDGPLYTMDYREKVLTPMMVYVSPAKEVVKTRDLSGKAYIDFPVGKTVIYPNYRRNPKELQEIQRTIDEVREDKDVTITSISFTGYASPEGPYKLNEKLAKGRTEALIKYVTDQYHFPANVMHSSWVAEDWAGLAAQVKDMDIANKEAILTLIDNDAITPDERDNKLAKDYPVQYTYLLNNVYPSLRRSDYKVEYTVRSFTDVQEIAVLVKTAPQKLSLDELFLYASGLDKGSKEFQDVMEVAVRMYPDNPVANLNAAAIAASVCDTKRAREYLKKAGNTPEAVYTLGVIEAKEGNYAAAVKLLKQASQQGVKEAGDLLRQIEDFGFNK